MKQTTRWLLAAAVLGAFFGVRAVAAPAQGGAVYAMTNQVGNNQILVYQRAANGTLTLMQVLPTGGGGGGPQLDPVDSLGSQGGLILDDAHQRLFVVNTESLAGNSQDCQEGTITSFLVGGDGTLTFVDKVSSGGLYPDSLTVRSSGDDENGDDSALLYVLNAGGPGASPACGTPPNITGFRVNSLGQMHLLAGSVQSIIDPGPLNGTGSGENCNVGGFPTPAFDCGRNPPAFPRSPGQIGFTPDGKHLIVTVKGTNSIYVFPVGEHGVPRVIQAPGPALPTYFGFAFDQNGNMILTEAFGKATSIPAGGAGAVSSFTVSGSGALTQISASVGDGGTAACWIALEPITRQFAYVGNNISNNISSYSVGNDGSVTLLAASAAAASGPNDMAAAAQNGKSFLYVLNGRSGKVGAFQVNLADGSLTAIGPADGYAGLPVDHAAQGLAAY